MQEAPQDPDAVRRFAGRMQQESLRLSALVQDLIDLSRLEVNDPLVPADRVSIDRVVMKAADQLRLAAQQRSIAVVVGGEHNLEVLGDEGQLVRRCATSSTMRSATALSRPGWRSACAAQMTWSRSVSRTRARHSRVGPTADLRAFRIDPARSRRTGGTGLGLAIVKHITTNHGGEVSVWSAEGAGSTFTLRLPLAAPARLPTPRPSTSVTT